MMKSSLIYNMLLLAKAMATDAKMISLELEQVPIMEYFAAKLTHLVTTIVRTMYKLYLH